MGIMNRQPQRPNMPFDVTFVFALEVSIERIIVCCLARPLLSLLATLVAYQRNLHTCSWCHSCRPTVPFPKANVRGSFIPVHFGRSNARARLNA
jgi:hypothetical protein